MTYDEWNFEDKAVFYSKQTESINVTVTFLSNTFIRSHISLITVCRFTARGEVIVSVVPEFICLIPVHLIYDMGSW